MKALLLTCALMASGFVHGQDLLMANDTRRDLYTNDGENRGSWNGMLFQVGFPVGYGESDSLRIKYGDSYFLSYGAVMKGKLNGAMSFISDSRFTWHSYKIRQSGIKQFVDSGIYKRERLNMAAFELGLGLRFNFDVNRGQHLGWYLDILGFGGFRFVRRRTAVDEYLQNDVNTKFRITDRNVKYVNRWEWGAEARFGFGYTQVFGRFRLNQLFRQSGLSDFTELTPCTVGLSLTLPPRQD
jgi:hypothetical protein